MSATQTFVIDKQLKEVTGKGRWFNKCISKIIVWLCLLIYWYLGIACLQIFTVSIKDPPNQTF